MGFIRKIFIISALIIFAAQNSFAADVWVNDLRKIFLNNSAIIYEINLRTFGAQDINKNGIIEFDEAEESGTFLNAIEKLDEIAQKGINTIHVLPITSVGKTKALGTAGSLYAASSFNKLNPQLASDKSALSIIDQARKFINEAHKRRIRVIIDLPSCGSYDLYLERPELFVKDKTNQPVIPADWTDVRLLDAGTETKINQAVYNLYKEFVDLMFDIGADGIRADVATNKPAAFWKELIKYSKAKDPGFLWLAEASESWKDAVSDYAVFTSYDKLLDAGFDGYYGSYFNIKNWKTGKDLINQVLETNMNLSKFNDRKAVIGSFTTHDEMSPLLIEGPQLSKMIMWLNATLPVNSYFVDGFDTGDNYIYLWANKKAFQTFTDDDYYFVHRGKIDIFNFSRALGGKDRELEENFRASIKIKYNFMPIITNGKFTPLKTSNPSVFAYTMSYNNNSLLVIGNLDFRAVSQASVYIRGFSKEVEVTPLKVETIPTPFKGELKNTFNPGEIQVLYLNNFEVKK